MGLFSNIFGTGGSNGTSTNENPSINMETSEAMDKETVIYNDMVSYAANSILNGAIHDADTCFMNDFLRHRVLAANDLKNQYPEINVVLDRIVNSVDTLSVDDLYEERAMATQIAQKYTINGNVPDDLFLFLTAYAIFLSSTSTDRKTWELNYYMIKQVFSSAPFDGWKKHLFATILWFSNYSNFKDKVIQQH